MFLLELEKLATETSLIVVILLVVGVIFCFIEAIIPRFGFFGITGIVSVLAGIVVHAILSGSAIQVLVILFILAIFFSLIVLIFLRSAKYGLLAKLSLVENKTVLPTDYNDECSNNFMVLVGKSGKTITDCRPVGKIDIDGKIYEASSKTNYLLNEENIIVTEVEGNIIYIEKSLKMGEKK